MPYSSRSPQRLLNRVFLLELLLILTLGGIAAWRGQDALLRAAVPVGAAGWLLALYALTRSDQSDWAPWRGVLLFAASWLIFPLFKAIRLFWIGTTYDAPLLALDRALWGGRSLPEHVFSWEAPWLSELLSAGYFAFYFVVLLPIAWAAVKRRTPEGQRFLQGIVLMYLVGFAGYLLVPAGGPYMAFPDAFPYPPQGGPMTAFLVGLVAQGITGMDVFPSLHSGVSVFVWGFFLSGGYRLATLLLTPVVAAIVIATVYLRYHYGIDVMAGILLAALVLWRVRASREKTAVEQGLPLNKSFAGKGVFPAQWAFTLLFPLRGLIFSARELIRRLDLRETMDVLEVGPGPGYFSIPLARALSRGRLVLADIQQEMLDRARRRIGRAAQKQPHGSFAAVDYHRCDGAAFPFADASFDRIVLVAVIGEVDRQAHYLREFHRLLRQGGVLSLTELAGDPDHLSIDALLALGAAGGFVPDGQFGGKWSHTVNLRKAPGA